MKQLDHVRQSVFSAILRFMRYSAVNRFMVGYGAFFGIGLLMYFTITSLVVPTYYALAPARSFVDYYYARVADTPVGTEPQMTLCRRINYDAIRIDAVRTFIYVEKDGKESQVTDYNFKANISQGESSGNCINVRLRGQPMEEGTYRTITSIEFYVHGHRKTYSYNSNQYKMLPEERTDEQRINELQRQIDEIKGVDATIITPSAPITQPVEAPRQQSANVAPQQPTQTAQTTQDTTEVAKADEPKEPQSDVLGLVNGLLYRLGL